MLKLQLPKLVGDGIVPSLYKLFSTSIESESLYSGWKIAKLTLIFGKDVAPEIANYRPISLLSILSQILESEVNDSLTHHVFKEHGLASDNNRLINRGTLLSYSLFILWKHGEKPLIRVSQWLKLKLHELWRIAM